MSSKARRAISVLIAMVMFVALFAGCGTNGGTKSGDSTKPESSAAASTASTQADTGSEPKPDQPGWMQDTSPVTLTWFLDASWYANKWGDSVVSKYITEKTGVTIKFDVPSGDPNAVLSTQIASNSLDDILSVGFWESNFKKLMEGGFVHPLNKLAEQYDPYFLQVAGDACLKWYKQPDGNTYCIPNEAYTIKDMETEKVTNANETFLVRKDLYDEMGRPDMRTPDGFIAALKLIKEKYSTYKGQKIIPFYAEGGTSTTKIFGLEDMLQDFLAIPYEKDGKIYDRYTDPDYVTWLKTLRKAYEMKLITMDFFVDTADQVNKKTSNANYFAMCRAFTGIKAWIPTMSQKDSTITYEAIDGPSNSKLEPAKIFAGSMTGWLPVFISKNCKNPDRAIRFISYWASEEGQKDFFLGKKGETWDTIDGKDQFKPELIDLLNKDTAKFETQYGAGDTYWMLRNPVTVYKWRPAELPPVKQMLDWANNHADFSQGYVKELDPLGTSPEGVAFNKIQLDWCQTLPKLITAKTDTDFDKMFNDFIKRRGDNGFDKVQAYRQSQFETLKAKLAN